ncbi:MAG: flavin reductase family protein [Pseudorhodoplanes sp.]|uniref:flavin reductase family protein n=1 Tax=Pseudorhodoplanes sp. TaxID=1934341 RepID=UPI003D11AE19
MTNATDNAGDGAPIDARTFWHALGMRMVGVSVVTAQGEDGPAGFLALSATHVTADPPSMLVSIDDRTQALKAILHGRHFAINYLSASDQELADSFGGRGSLKGADRFESGRWRTLATGAPVLNDAIGAIDCSLAETFRFHSTTIAVGRVVAFDLSERSNALVFFGGRYRTITVP